MIATFSLWEEWDGGRARVQKYKSEKLLLGLEMIVNIFEVILDHRRKVKFLNTVLLYAFVIMSILFQVYLNVIRNLEQCKVENLLFFQC